MPYNEVAKHEEVLATAAISAIILRTSENNYALYTEASNEENAIDTINIHRDWTLLSTYSSYVKALYHNDVLEDNNIPATIINDKDSSFMVGEIELHVETKNRKAANKIIALLETQTPE